MDQPRSDKTEGKVAGAPTETAAASAPSVTDGVSTVAVEQPTAEKALPPEPAGSAESADAAAILEERAKAEKLKAEVDDLRALLEKAQVGATESEDLTKRIDLLSEQVDKQKQAARLRVLDSMGVMEHLKKYAPEVDVDTDEGMSQLQKWAEAHPEFIASVRSEEGPAFTPDQLRKKFKSPHLGNIELLRGRKP